jgi:UDP-glucuronate 4-epimerase
VYGSLHRSTAQHKDPISVYDKTDHSISLYAAPKKANEMMAHSDSLYTGYRSPAYAFLRLWAWVAPDMAIFLRAKATTEDRPIKLLTMARCPGTSLISNV